MSNEKISDLYKEENKKALQKKYEREKQQTETKDDRKSYGLYFVVLIILYAVMNVVVQNVGQNPTTPFTAFILVSIQAILGVSAFGYLILWIIDLIRRRNK